MKYPQHIIDLYKKLQDIEVELVAIEGRNYYDKEAVIRQTQSRYDELLDKIQEEASIYAAETGADRDGSYDPDNVIDDLI